MTLLAAAALGIGAASLLTPLIVSAMTLMKLATGAPRLGKPRLLVALLLTVPYVLWWQTLRESQPINVLPLSFLQLFGLYMLLLGTYHLLAAEEGGNIDYSAACAIIAMCMAGTASFDSPMRHVYGPIAAMFFLLLLLYMRARIIDRPHPRRIGRAPAAKYVAAGVVLIGCVAAAHVLVVERLPELNRRLVRRLLAHAQQPSPGFDRVASLGDVPRIWDDGAAQQIVVRQFGADGPAYLRGAAYDRYIAGNWRIIEEDRVLEPTGWYAGRRVFNAMPQSADEPAATVYTADEFAGVFFLPPGVHEMAAFTSSVMTSGAYTMRPHPRHAAGGYAWYAPAAPLPKRDDRAALLDIPDEARGPLADVARRIVPDLRDATPRAKIRAVERFFAEGFEYRRGIELDRRRDPVVQFVEEIRAGHCEYFASAAALLLRAMDVPTRYVTGFVCGERALGGGHWVARRKDAHAWVEAWIEGEGWVTVEPTPPDARPQVAAATGSQRFGEWFAGQWDRVARLVMHGGVRGVLGALWHGLLAIPSLIPMPAWIALVAAGLLWTFRANLANLIRRRSTRPLSPHAADMHAKLQLALRMLAPHGLTCPPHMTVGRLLETLAAADLPDDVRSAAAHLLTEYQRERFRPARSDP